MRGSLELMNQKDAVIQSLQSQLLESTHTADELIHIQTQLQNLQHRYSLLQNEHVLLSPFRSTPSASYSPRWRHLRRLFPT